MTASLKTPPAHSMFRGHVEEFANGVLRGWAVDVRGRGPVTLHLLADGQERLQIICDQPRPNVSKALGTPSENLGFHCPLPASLFDGKTHQIALRFPDRSPLLLPDPARGSTPSESATFDGKTVPERRSFVDGMENDVLRGWVVVRANPASPWEGKQLVSVKVDGISLGVYRADHYRGDVSGALHCEPGCGFEIPLPGRLYDKRVHRFELTLVPAPQDQALFQSSQKSALAKTRTENGKNSSERNPLELQGSPYVTSLVQDELESRLVEMEGVITALHRQLTSLRREVRNLVPKPRPTLHNYERWAEANRARLRRETAAKRLTAPLSALLKDANELPLVSVLCPVWRPLPSDFEAAIASVRAQTYAHWELILVDDGGGCAGTQEIIDRYCALDSRIKRVTLAENGGISTATNAAISAARGTWVAFFDHDDLMMDVALENMVRAALETGAKLIYSDEDKIDEAGHYLEPHFKPDFDYRFLLGCNYICHLVMMETETLRALGPLDSAYDGAQDHDLMLRAAERLPPTAIHHVPEILYHWRKTKNSTAATLSNKSYAVQAAVSCVKAHLDRRGVKAKVTSIDGVTHYRVTWQGARRAPLVTVVIPFRDQPDVTRRCVEDFLASQDYRNYRLLLVDNFSIEPETHAFLNEIVRDPRVSVLRVEEDFNFSRLNNLAVAASAPPAENAVSKKSGKTNRQDDSLLLFLNNDVFVTQKDFLTRMVRETLNVPDVGAVGAKLLYPNGGIQHAGLAVGPDMVGFHVHHGLGPKDYGYVGRLLLSHEVTGVTGAALLVKRAVFEAVGGFDQEHLTIAYNDVDLCLKIRQAGWRILYCADAVAEHHESLSRGTDDRPEKEGRWFHEAQTVRERWGGNPLFDRDPAYPHVFRQDRQSFFDLRPPEEL